MKKLFFISLFACVASCVQAQSAASPAENGTPAPQSQSVTVKWNPSSLYFGKIGLQGEYNYKKKKSLTFSLGIPAEKKMTFSLDDEDRSIAMKSFSAMGGYRMYLGKRTITGFYFEPYLKYVSNKAATQTTEEIGGEPTVFALTSQYFGFGAGAQLGVQFMIARRVVFDLFLLGPEANMAKHSVLMRDISGSGSWSSEDAAEAEQELNDVVGDLPIIGDNIDVKVDAASRTVSSSYRGFLPGFRGGLSVGIRF